MNNFEINSRATEYFRGNELSPGVVETQKAVETPVSPQTNSTVQARIGNDQPLSPEREKEIEAWMEQIKAFIRSIDVNSL